MGICTVAFLPVEAVSPRAHELYAKAKATVERLAREGMSPGLLDQYKIQLERLEPGKHQSGPGCEILYIPGFMGPGECSMSECAWWKASDGVSVVMPEDSEGKKYVCWLYGTNHAFSRGSIVRTNLYGLQVDADMVVALSISPRAIRLRSQTSMPGTSSRTSVRDGALCRCPPCLTALTCDRRSRHILGHCQVRAEARTRGGAYEGHHRCIPPLGTSCTLLDSLQRKKLRLIRVCRLTSSLLVRPSSDPQASTADSAVEVMKAAYSSTWRE